MQRTAWLIGASRGMGFETARLLASQGWQVLISARDESSLKAACDSIAAAPLPLDITQPESVQSTCQAAFRNYRPQLVIINAGDYQPMSLAEFDVELFVRLNAVNYLGVVYLLDSLLPLLRDNGGGELIVNASSAAYRGLPGGAPYSAPKAATLNLVESLRNEARLWNINLRVINPGFVRSSLTDKNRFRMPAIMNPEQAAERIVKAIGKESFEISFPRRFTSFLKLLRCLPYRWYFALTQQLVSDNDQRHQ